MIKYLFAMVMVVLITPGVVYTSQTDNMFPSAMLDLTLSRYIQLNQDKGTLSLFINLKDSLTMQRQAHKNDSDYFLALSTQYSKYSDKNCCYHLIAQNGSEDLTHQALASALNETNIYYFIKTGGTVPILDETFREFVDYGAFVSLGAVRKLDDKISLSLSLDMVLLTGDWSIAGDRKSIEVAAESWAPGYYNDPGQTTITTEELPDQNLGIGYHGEAEAFITSSESLKKIDVHTDLYLFPIKINALYKFNVIGKITPYAGGGIGFCVANRSSDSKALKSENFNGPQYSIRFNNSQTRNGMLLNLLGGLNIPVYKSMKFIAEADMTYYDINNFDPILEISMTKPQNPSVLGGNDVSTYSYEDALHIGVFNQEFVGNFSIGLFMPF